jgi:AcrR family transcriptional regulator
VTAEASTRPPKRRLREPQRRRVILDAAREVFARHGPEAVAMAEIAQIADVTRSVLYDHFASKEAILRAVLEEHHAAFMATLSQAGPGELDEATFRELTLRYLEQADADPAGWRILCLEPSSDPDLAAYQNETGREIDDWLAARLGTGRSRAERRAMARALRAAVNELVAARRENPRLSRQALADIAAGLWRGLHAAGRPRPQ